VAVRRRAGDVLSRQRSVRAGTILDDDVLVERDAERLGDDTADRVACAAWSEHCDQRDRLARIVLGAGRRTDQGGAGGQEASPENAKQVFQGRSPMDALIAVRG